MSEARPPSPLVLLLLAEGFEDLEAAAIRSVCGWTEYRQHLPTVGVVTTGLRETVRGRFGAVVRPDLLVGEVEAAQYAALAIPVTTTIWVGLPSSAR